MKPDRKLALQALTRPATVSLGQGIYYAVTAVWPLVNMRSFEFITGKKVDRWLVKTVGVLIGVIGAVLIRAGRRQEPGTDAALLAMGSAVGLTAIDVFYVGRRRIRPVYLLDAVGEIALVALWLRAVGSRRSA